MRHSNATLVRPVNPASPDPSAIAEAGAVLRRGGLVVLPTETVYGLAADAFNPAAVARLRAAKARPETKPLPVMVGGIDDIDTFAIRVPLSARAIAKRRWPGPLTIVLFAGDRVSEAVHSGTAKVALRSPDHEVAHAVLAAARRPLVLTSANVSGEAPALTAGEALAALGGRVDMVLDAGPCSIGEASTVLDMTTIPPTVLREGAIASADLFEGTPGV